MADDKQAAKPTQLTQPKKGKPIEIPVPTERDVMELLEKAALAGPGEQTVE
jgi:hypothetical protein